MMTIGAREMMACLPEVPFRHWVVSYPFQVNQKLAFQPRTIIAAEKAVIGVLRKWLESRALGGGKYAGVVVRHRAGSNLNLQIHIHLLLTDGVFAKCEDLSEWGFAVDSGFGQSELDELAQILRKRIHKCLKRLGIEDSDAASDKASAFEDDRPLAGIASRANGLHLFASNPIPRESRGELYETCRYLLRGFLVPERLAMEKDGTITYRLNKKDAKGNRTIRYTPNEFMLAIASLVPRANVPANRYIGLLASGSKLRKKILPEFLKIENQKKALHSTPVSETDEPGLNWAELMTRTFGVDFMRCPRCLIFSLEYKVTLYSQKEYRKYMGIQANARAPPGASASV